MQLKKLLTIITKIISSVIIVIYPFIIFYALKQNIAVRFLGLVLLAMIIVSFLRNKNTYLFVLGLTLALLVILFNQDIFLKFYPVLMNSAICAIFALSLRKTPLITQIAQKMQKTPLNKKTVEYTQKVTYAWTIFMFVNAINSLITVFLSNEIWALYNGFISYILIGTMMLVEYIIRKRKEKCLHQ